MFRCFAYKDELELRYKLHSGRDAEVLWSRVKNLADGRLHTVTIRRLADAVSVQVNTEQQSFDINLCLPLKIGCTDIRIVHSFFFK